MKLTYWIAECQDDSTCYSIREKTKKAVIGMLIAGGFKRIKRIKGFAGRLQTGHYSDTYKVTFEYINMLDAVQVLLSESKDGHEVHHGEESKYCWVRED